MIFANFLVRITLEYVQWWDIKKRAECYHANFHVLFDSPLILSEWTSRFGVRITTIQNEKN